MNEYLKEMRKQEQKEGQVYLYIGVILGVTYFSFMYYLLVQFSRGMML